jgi:NAD(P)-dependent dehydrogenase (short-subunit alcohol dehydrogenase family)
MLSCFSYHSLALVPLQVCDAAVQKVVKELGGLDIIVNNAGAGVGVAREFMGCYEQVLSWTTVHGDCRMELFLTCP